VASEEVEAQRYLAWLAAWAIDTDSLIIWQERDGGIQPVLLPNDPFRWLDASTLHEDTEGASGGVGDVNVH
jgi:hypothetical protein